jgi:hypothetical protein
MDPATSTVLLVIAIALGAIILLGAVIVWMKGRPFTQGEVFRASRLSKGNRLLPTQVLVSPTSVIHYTPQWFGKYEHSIHMAHVASVGIDTHVIFSDVLIETTGGTSPIHCKGHYRSHAVRMKQLIEQYQTAYFKGAHAPDALPLGH